MDLELVFILEMAFAMPASCTPGYSVDGIERRRMADDGSVDGDA